jgi:hypothetical protein
MAYTNVTIVVTTGVMLPVGGAMYATAIPLNRGRLAIVGNGAGKTGIILAMAFGLSKPTRTFWILLFLWSITLTLLVYGRSLTLPFFFDDLLLLPYVAETPLVQLWGEPAVFPYFRPLPATFWRLSYLVWGSHQPVWLHGGNLLLHAINGWLLAYLGVRLFSHHVPKPDYQIHILALSSATFYLLFPFHFQAVPWITAVYHLAVATFILASVTAYLQYRQSGRFRWAFLGGLLALAALFTQETGVLILPLVILLAFFTGERHIWRSWATFLPWAVPLSIWFPLWLLTPRTTSELALNNLETIGQNGSWLMQGAAFPLTWAGGWLHELWGWNDLGTALALSLLGLGSVAIAQARGYNTPLSGFAWGWCLLSSLVTLLLLPFAYLLSSPRLLTLMAVGAAWLWGEMLAHLLGTAWQKRQQASRAALSGALAAGLLLLAVGPAWLFLQKQMTFHTTLGRVYWQLTTETTAANAAGDAVVAINFPSTLGDRRSTFALGHEGIVFVAVYIPTDNIVTTQTGAPAHFRLLRHEDIRPEGDYMADVLGAGQNWPDIVDQTGSFTVLHTNFEEETISLWPAGAWPGVSVSGSDPAEFRVDPATSIWLDEGRATAEDDRLRVDLNWRIAQPPPYTVTVFVHAIGFDGSLVTQADGYAWASTYPMGQWPPGAVVQDTRFIPLTEEVQRVYVGLYDSVSGERLDAFIDGEHVGPDNSIRLTVE